jgi:SAM-dependent methyltransferase
MYRTLATMLVLLGLTTLSLRAGRAADDLKPRLPVGDAPARESNKADVVYVPTPNDVVLKMLELARVGKDDLLYDLGCGDGRIVVLAAKKYGCKGVGYDIDPQRIKECHAGAKKYDVEALVKFEQQDIFQLDLSKASVVTLYLLPDLNVRLIPQLQKLKPGARIVSHDFSMKGRLKPDKVLTITSKEDNVEHTLYLWTAPLKEQKAAADEE